MKKQLIRLICLCAFVISGCHDESNVLNIRICDENAQKCDKNNIMACKNGVWIVLSTCLTDSNTGEGSCIVRMNNGKEEYSCGICTEGNHRFFNDDSNLCQREICNQGEWILDLEYSCKSSCNINVSGQASDAENTCGECINNTKKCEFDIESNSSIIQTCQTGRWTTEETCENAHCYKTDDNSDYRCGICINDSERYISNDEEFCQHQICSNAQWVYTESFNCTFSCNTNETGETDPDAPCGECLNRATRYHELNSVCFYQQCENGKWTDLPNSNNEKYPCIRDENDNPIQIGECINETKRCDGDNLQFCFNGTWKTQAECQKCDDSSCTDSSCEPICNKMCEEGSCTMKFEDEIQAQVGFICKNDRLIPCSNQMDKTDDNTETEYYSCATKTTCGNCLNGTGKSFHPDAQDSSLCQYQLCENGKYQPESESVYCPNNPDTAYNDALTKQNSKQNEIASCKIDYNISTKNDVQYLCGECNDSDAPIFYEAKHICRKVYCNEGVVREDFCPNLPNCTLDSNGIPNGCGECRNDSDLTEARNNNQNRCEYRKYQCSGGKIVKDENAPWTLCDDGKSCLEGKNGKLQCYSYKCNTGHPANGLLDYCVRDEESGEYIKKTCSGGDLVTLSCGNSTTCTMCH